MFINEFERAKRREFKLEESNKMYIYFLKRNGQRFMAHTGFCPNQKINI